MQVKVFTEVLYDNGDVKINLIDAANLPKAINGLEKIYIFTEAQATDLENTLNYLGLQDMYEELKTSKAFVYLTTDKPLEDLQELAKANKATITGVLTVYTEYSEPKVNL